MTGTARPESGERVRVFLDNCVWDFLFERQIDLAGELPQGRFELFVVREVEFEIEPIEQRKPALARFIRETISRAHIRTWRAFGFWDDRHSEEDQRVGGFGDADDSSEGGAFFEEDESVFEAELVRVYQRSEEKRRTGLYRNETDVALAVRSLHSVVLTLDRDNGPLRRAFQRGGKVVFLNEVNSPGASLAAIVMAACNGPSHAMA
jgi:hypothetical protein